MKLEIWKFVTRAVELPKRRLKVEGCKIRVVNIRIHQRDEIWNSEISDERSGRNIEIWVKNSEGWNSEISNKILEIEVWERKKIKICVEHRTLKALSFYPRSQTKARKSTIFKHLREIPSFSQISARTLQTTTAESEWTYPYLAIDFFSRWKFRDKGKVQHRFERNFIISTVSYVGLQLYYPMFNSLW